MVSSKKRITTELLYLGLVITLLRGNPQRIGNYDNIISTNFFNDVDPLENIDNILVEGPNWAFSRTNYHRLRMYADPGIEHFKTLSGNHDFYYDDYPESLDNDEAVIEDELYRQQARLLLLSQLNTAYARKDPIQTFRDITAYLVSDTTTENLPNSLAGIPITPAASSGGSGGPTVSPSPSVPPSPVADSGHDSGDSGDESVRLSFSSESEPDLAKDKSDAVLWEVGESDSQFEEEEPMQTSSDNVLAEVQDLNAETDVNALTLNSDLNWQLIDPNEYFDFIINNNNDGAQYLGAASLPISGPPSRSSFSHELGDPRFDQSMVSDLFDFEHLRDGEVQEPSEEMQWTLAEEEAHLDFYKKFNDVANSEVLRTVPIQVIEGREAEPGDEAPDSLDLLELGAITDPTLDQVIDDWLETDSGVFEFLESPGVEATTFDFDVPSVESQFDSIETELDVDGESSAGVVDGEMIQAASIHPNGRPTPHHPNHQPRAFQVHGRMPGYLRGGPDVNQRWQEIANLLSFPQGSHDGSGSLPFVPQHLHHHHHHTQSPHHHLYPFPTAPPTAPYNVDSARSVLLQNATLPPPEAYPSMGPPPNIASAVASSMHLTNTSDPMIDPSNHYKILESNHDMIYYPNASNNAGGEMNNQTTEGFLSSILNLNEDNLQLMDMEMHEGGMYSMRSMLDLQVGASSSIPHDQTNLPHGGGNGCGAMGAGAMAEDRMEASSDSAVSSMGSERVPPMTDPSDSEWVDPDSHPHSSHDSSPYSLEYSGGKPRGYDYYGKDRGVAAPVAQKKHHMFGKRFQQEQGLPYVLPHHPGLPYPSSSGLHPSSPLDSLDMKYGCGVEFARHQNDLRLNGGLSSLDQVHNNHTYALPPSHQDNNGLSTFKAPKPPSKDKQKKESLSRDEKRARGMNLPITTDDIINLPMDEFNERLSKYELSDTQLSLIRDIRRRGKNKVAAQNCRKRKLDQIHQLSEEVERIRERKQNLLREQLELSSRRHDLKDRYQILYRHVFQGLRDSNGNSYNPMEFSLQQAADGNVILVPRNVNHPPPPAPMAPAPSRRDKTKDDYKKE